MGSLLYLPTHVATDWRSTLLTLKQAGFLVVALCLTPSAVELSTAMSSTLQNAKSVLVLVGNEGIGLSKETIACASLHLRIAMAPGVDSLNVHVSSAIALHALFSHGVRPHADHASI